LLIFFKLNISTCDWFCADGSHYVVPSELFRSHLKLALGNYLCNYSGKSLFLLYNSYFQYSPHNLVVMQMIKPLTRYKSLNFKHDCISDRPRANINNIAGLVKIHFEVNKEVWRHQHYLK